MNNTKNNDHEFTQKIHNQIFDIMDIMKNKYKDYPQYQVIMQSLTKVAVEINSIRITEISGNQSNNNN